MAATASLLAFFGSHRYKKFTGAIRWVCTYGVRFLKLFGTEIEMVSVPLALKIVRHNLNGPARSVSGVISPALELI